MDCILLKQAASSAVLRETSKGHAEHHGNINTAVNMSQDVSCSKGR